MLDQTPTSNSPVAPIGLPLPAPAPGPLSDADLLDVPQREYVICERRIREIVCSYLESDEHAAAATSAIMTIAQEYARAIGRLYLHARRGTDD